MEEEISTLDKNERWEKCELPREKKTVGCKWVYIIKYQLMVLLNGTKEDWQHKGILRPIGWIILKLSHQWLKWKKSGYVLNSYKQRLATTPIQCEEFFFALKDRGRGIYKSSS